MSPEEAIGSTVGVSFLDGGNVVGKIKYFDEGCIVIETRKDKNLLRFSKRAIARLLIIVSNRIKE